MTTRAETLEALAETSPAEAVAQALSALESLQVEDGIILAMTCVQIVARHGTGADAPRLKALRPRLPAIVALRDWRFEASFALRVLEGRARGECACEALAASGDRPIPDDFEVLSETLGDWVTTSLVRCCACDRRYSVRRDDGYHYPTFSWTTSPSPAAGAR